MFNWYLEILQFRFLKDTNRKLIKNWLSYQEGCDCCVFLGNGATLHVAARDLGIEPQLGTQPNLVQMACRTPRGWQHGADKHLYVSRIAGVMGETGSIWWNNALLLPLAFTNCHEAQGRGGKNLKRDWKRVREGSIKEGRREGLDKMNYAKLSETAIVGGAGCVKGSQRWSSAASLSPLPLAQSRLIRAPANGQ